MSNNPRPRSLADFFSSETASDAGDAGPLEALARRKFSRFRVELDVTITSAHNFYAGFVENMSVGGIFIATHQLKPVGERLELAVRLPNHEEPIRGTGEVRWVRVYSEASNVPPGMGIRFDTLDPRSRQLVEGFLAQREPLFYEED